MQPILLAGPPALSGFRLKSLLEKVREQAPRHLQVATVQADYVYFLETDQELSPETATKTYALLGSTGPFNGRDGFFVTPRKGTISPWSSKASDIFRNCGLDTIHRVERGVYFCLMAADGIPHPLTDLEALAPLLFDRMIEGVYTEVDDLFAHPEPAPMQSVDILTQGRDALAEANIGMGLALSDEEIDYLYQAYQSIERNPTDVELVMFGQVNSEHCRHKIFNAAWVVDGEKKEDTLFGMIKHTHACHPEGTLVAYKDNAGVLEGFADTLFAVNLEARAAYGYLEDQIDLVLKVETHNHPTAISPYPGAATGVGGEIRDESATGTGGKSKAGLGAFMVSNLNVPGFGMPWEKEHAEFPGRLATPLDIMLEGPIGGANFGNEFGRPQLLGLFRTYEEQCAGRYRGYHKPIMAAGGLGNIRRGLVEKHAIPPGARIIQLGGPAMRIGLGGGAASSMATGSNAAELDFNSVQRGNAEMERRCQEVIDTCTGLGAHNPILSIHDIGAGGLSNGCPELVAETGGAFHLRDIHNEDRSMSPMEIWCCEAQERYVLAVSDEDVARFLALCERERCPVAVIGTATGDGHLSLEDRHFGNKPIDIDLGVILGKAPRMVRDVRRLADRPAPLDTSHMELTEAARRVLQLPAVADKTFLITIADRSVTGMVARDQMTGPYQEPISDAAVTITSYTSVHGEAMAMGERTPVALIDGPASGRMAVGEALTNLAGVNVGQLGVVRLSANWMCACGEEGEDAKLFDTVQAVGLELCPTLGVAIPVGKDSLSMRSQWESSTGRTEKQVAPLSLLVSAFAPVQDVRRTVTADLKPGPSRLLLLDLGEGRNRLGGSALAQVYNQVGDEAPDLDHPERFAAFFSALQTLVEQDLLLAYHDRSDGGLLATLCEMAFGGRCGLDIDLAPLEGDDLAVLFSEELGAVLQVAEEQLEAAWAILADHGLADLTHALGTPSPDRQMTLRRGESRVYRESLSQLHRWWSELTFRMQTLRDNPSCVQEEYDRLLDEDDPGLQFNLSFDPAAPFHIGGTRPPMAVLREQGINGQVEMAAAFDRAGFACTDVHMTDLLSGRVTLDAFQGLVACGGFSYGDVLGAGSGWAKSVLYNEALQAQFAAFFSREDTFALGVCNGCQMMAQLKDIIPGAQHWPTFSRNRCEQFEARYVTVEILPSPSVFFTGMEGSRIGIPVAHGEGRADFEHTGSLAEVRQQHLAAARYVDHRGAVAERYPDNPNGSPEGLTGLTTTDGRVTIMMPHPERVFRSVQLSYAPETWKGREEGPWLRMFQNARTFTG